MSKIQAEQFIDAGQFAKDNDYELSKEFNLIILKKQYTSPYDIPCVTIGEVEFCLNGITKILNSVNHERLTEKGLTPFGLVTKNVLLDPIGVEKLVKGVSVQELSENSRKNLQSLCFWNYLRRPLEKFIGSEGIWNPGRSISDFSFQVRGKSTFSRVADKENSFDFSSELRTDITSAAEAAKVFNKFEAPQSLQSISLWELTERLSTKSTKCEVDSSLAGKTVTVIGDVKLSTPARLLRAVAQIYGLSIKNLQAKDGSQILRLTERPIRLPKNYMEVADCVLESLPTPLYRSCIKFEKIASNKSNSELQKEFRERIKTDKEFRDNPTSYFDFFSAVNDRELNTTINSSRGRFIGEVCGSYISIALQNECKTTGKPGISKSISELSERQKQWFILNRFARYVDDIRGSYGKPPKYLLNFDELIVRCKQIGEDRGSIELGYPGENVFTGPASFFQSIVPDR